MRGDREVHLAVGVEVRHRHRQRLATPQGGADGRPETAVAVAQQDAHVPATLVGRRQVELAVVVEVANGHGPGVGSGGEVVRGAEPAPAVAEQDAHGAVVVKVVVSRG